MNGALIKFLGNVTNKGELQYSNNDGTPNIILRVACNRFRGPDQPQDTTFFNVRLWRHTAQYAHENVEVGLGVMIEGILSIREYTRNDGKPGVSCKVSARDFEIVTRGAPAAHFWAKHRPRHDRPGSEPDTEPESPRQPETPAPPAPAPPPQDHADLDDPEYHPEFYDED